MRDFTDSLESLGDIQGKYPQGTLVLRAQFVYMLQDQFRDLEESHKKEVRQLLILNREQANAANRLRDSMEQAIRHHKYKRCLALAKMCQEKAAHYRAEYNAEEGFGDGWLKWIRWARKWGNRWLAIAEKFKETK